MDKSRMDAYVNILEEELVMAMGCTEPIAIAYASAIARKYLGQLPEKVDVRVSSNIIKNVKSVVVPHTGGLRGIDAATAAGVVLGDPEQELEVLSQVPEERVPEIAAYLEKGLIHVAPTEGSCIFDIRIRVSAGKHSAAVRIAGAHTNVIYIEKDGQIILSRDYKDNAHVDQTDHTLLSVEEIVEFANTVPLERIRPVLDRQISCNMAIAREGLQGQWGANIGSVLLAAYGDSVHNRAKAMAAAGSDARMSGCELPVVINSGSGNQGLTASVPVIVYAQQMQVSEEKLYRALAVSNLVTIHLKTGIGRLSAYCGATSAGCGAGAGIMYLNGGDASDISHTVVNAVAINSGMICDGAKASCAAKIASAVEAGLLGMQMRLQGKQFCGGDGIVTKGVENTIDNVGRVARYGMAETDREIIQIMVSDKSPRN